MKPPPLGDEKSDAAPHAHGDSDAIARAVAFFAAGDGPEPTFRLAEFQSRALEAARRILARRNGVLVADGVGLGKTFVALALIEEELRRGGKVLVTAPAALRRHWQVPLMRLVRRYGCSSSGLGGSGRRPAGTRGHVDWITHTGMSRGWTPSQIEVRQTLTVVDEAHGYRNPTTRRYRALAACCASGRVLLLTATPVCNSLSDLYFLIRLFASDTAFRDVGVMDLMALLCGDRPDTERVRRVLAEIMVRRSRTELQAACGRLSLPGGSTFPQLRPPLIVRYECDARVSGMLRQIELLRFPAFRPEDYGGASAGGHASELLRCMLLKRLESSEAAARASIHRLGRFLHMYTDALARGRLLTARDFRSIAAEGSGAEQLIFESLILEPSPQRLDVRRLRHDCVAEIALLREMDGALGGPADAKLAALAGVVHGRHGVIVFTEFQETAALLWRALMRAGQRVARVDGSGAWLGGQRTTRAAVIARFAPAANGFRRPHPRERVDILIATDLLSEGLNLQDAQTVVSYDLPWNPTRLMQRVGRIDRLGSPHASISSYVFLPGEHLEQVLRLVRRIRGKLRTIEDSVGVEASPLDPPAWVPDAAAIEALRDGRQFAAGDARPLAPPAQSHFAFASTVGGRESPCGDQHGTADVQSVAVCLPGARPGVLLLGLLGDARAACFYDAGLGALAPVGADEIRTMLCRCNRADRSRPASLPLVERALDAARGTAISSGPPTGATARVARHVLRALAAETGSSVLERGSRVLRRLRGGVPIGAELELRGLVRTPAPEAEILVAAVEEILDRVAAATPPNFRASMAVEVCAGQPACGCLDASCLVDTSACGG